jgi:hypothetical protein
MFAIPINRVLRNCKGKMDTTVRPVHMALATHMERKDARKAPMASEADHIGLGWQVQYLRLTAFLATPLDPAAGAALWETATGMAPEVDDSRPREAARRQAGEFGGGLLEAVMTPARIDWVMAPKTEPNAPVPVSFTSLEDGMKVFGEAGHQWMQIGSPSISRLAVGAGLLAPMTDVKTCYQKLGSILRSVRVDPDHSSDFFYQINWPQESRVVPGLMLNRLTKWNAVGIRRVNFHSNEAAFQTFPTDITYYCRLECDHNTVEEHVEPFDTPDLQGLFRELCDLVLENARNGEVTAWV